jgi:hypothetical protein
MWARFNWLRIGLSNGLFNSREFIDPLSNYQHFIKTLSHGVNYSYLRS